MIKIREAVIVEGRYDKIKLSSILDGIILETRGFGIFKDPQQLALIRKLAQTRGILILTDSDSAGFVIRNFLSGAVNPQYIKHAYIPDIAGKEKRKASPSKEGKLGVEGVSREVVLSALRRAGASFEEEDGTEKPSGREITKGDLYVCGLSGGERSAEKRQILLKRLDLPEHLSVNALVKVLNSMMSYEEYCSLTKELFSAEQQ